MLVCRFGQNWEEEIKKKIVSDKIKIIWQSN